LPLHQTVTLQLPAANNGTAAFKIAFPDLKQFSLFHVKKDSGVPLVYATFILTMAGLLTKLYLRPFLERRRRTRRAMLLTRATPAQPELAPQPRVREEVLTR
jgi:cytochrome c biogenesis protein ResB